MPLRFWINAFIPKTVEGYTRVVPTGPHVGKTAIPLPALADLNPVNLWKDLWNWWDTGYLTDQRTFDTAPTASVRMRSWVEIDPSTLTATSHGHESSGTTEVDLKTGVQLGFKVANMSKCSWTLPVIQPLSVSPSFPAPVFPGPPSGVSALTLNREAAASDPLVSAAADIDYEGMVVVSPVITGLSVTFGGKIDTFPAFEAYASLNGETKQLFQAPPPSGNTVTALPGRANRPIRGIVAFTL